MKGNNLCRRILKEKRWFVFVRYILQLQYEIGKIQPFNTANALYPQRQYEKEMHQDVQYLLESLGCALLTYL